MHANREAIAIYTMLQHSVGQRTSTADGMLRIGQDTQEFGKEQHSATFLAGRLGNPLIAFLCGSTSAVHRGTSLQAADILII